MGFSLGGSLGGSLLRTAAQVPDTFDEFIVGLTPVVPTLECVTMGFDLNRNALLFSAVFAVVVVNALLLPFFYVRHMRRGKARNTRH